MFREEVFLNNSKGKTKGALGTEDEKGINIFIANVVFIEDINEIF
jgi:hypothetical protein